MRTQYISIEQDATPTILLSSITVELQAGSSRKVLFGGLDAAFYAPHSYSIVGPNGCGKSTLLRIILGLTQPTLGRVTTPLFAPGAVGYVPQNFSMSLLPWLTALENMLLPLRATRSSVTDSAVSHLIKSLHFPLLSRAELSKYPQQLSGGQRQLIAIARSLVTSPLLLVLDEPFSALDIKLRPLVRHALRSIARDSGTLVFFVGHDVREAIEMADEIVTLNNSGSIAARHTVRGDAANATDPPPETLLVLEKTIAELIASL